MQRHFAGSVRGVKMELGVSNQNATVQSALRLLTSSYYFCSDDELPPMSHRIEQLPACIWWWCQLRDLLVDKCGAQLIFKKPTPIHLNLRTLHPPLF